MGSWGIVGACAAVAALLATGLIPFTEAGHCDTRIAVYGRSALGPGIVPPKLLTGQPCPEIAAPNASGHALPPGTDQIYVRVEADLGAGYPVVLMWLQGQGFRGQQFTLTRTEGTVGTVTYTPEDWLSIPDLDEVDGITATVRFPGNHLASAHYDMNILPVVVTE